MCFPTFALGIAFSFPYFLIGCRLWTTRLCKNGEKIAPYFGRWARVINDSFFHLTEVVGDRALRIGYDKTIYVLFGDKRCPATYVNETPAPNARLVAEDLPASDVDVDIPPDGCWLVASEDIPADTFIHVDYGSSYWLQEEQAIDRQTVAQPTGKNKKQKTAINERPDIIDLSRADKVAG